LKDNRIYEFFTMFVTFFIVCIGLVLFRAESIGQAWEYVCGMIQFGTIRASYRFFTWPDTWPTNLFIVIMLVVEWMQRRKSHGLSIENYNKMLRWVLYSAIVILIVFEGGQSVPFVYFQF